MERGKKRLEALASGSDMIAHSTTQNFQKFHEFRGQHVKSICAGYESIIYIYVRPSETLDQLIAQSESH